MSDAWHARLIAAAFYVEFVAAWVMRALGFVLCIYFGGQLLFTILDGVASFFLDRGRPYGAFPLAQFVVAFVVLVIASGWTERLDQYPLYLRIEEAEEKRRHSLEDGADLKISPRSREDLKATFKLAFALVALVAVLGIVADYLS